MINRKHRIVWTILLLTGLVTVTFAEDITRTIQAIESSAKVIYNGKEVNTAIKTLSYNGYIYLPALSAGNILNKEISWNEKEQKLSITDKPNAEADGLRKELESKDKSIVELKEEIKALQKELSNDKMITVKGLQNKLNSEFKDYIGSSQRIIVSGNSDEIRVKIAVDLGWDSGVWSSLSSSEKTEFLQAVSASINSEYYYAKVRGYVKDISKSGKLMSFYNTSGQSIRTGYIKGSNPITVLEDKFNDDYDTYLAGICLIYDLTGSENRIDFLVDLDISKFDTQWGKLSDYKIKGLMKKITDEIAAQYKDCEINGSISDMSTEEELASCSKYPKQEFIFSRNR